MPAAFEHDALAGVGARRLLARQSGQPRDHGADHRVVLPVGILRPAIERPVHQDHVAASRPDAGWGRVAKPDAIGLHLVEANAIARDVVRLECRARGVDHILGVAEDFDRLVVGEHPDDLGVDPRNRSELSGPVRLVMRPADPGCPVRLPLRRHPHVRSRCIGSGSDRTRRRGGRAGTASCGARSRSAPDRTRRRRSPRPRPLRRRSGRTDRR